MLSALASGQGTQSPRFACTTDIRIALICWQACWQQQQPVSCELTCRTQLLVGLYSAGGPFSPSSAPDSSTNSFRGSHRPAGRLSGRSHGRRLVYEFGL